MMHKTSQDLPIDESASIEVIQDGDAASTNSGSKVFNEKIPSEAHKSGTILAGYSVLTKSMLGSGIFFMAHACFKFGIIASMIAVVVAWFITFLSLRILAVLAIEFKNDEPSFYSISQRIVPKYKWVIDAAIIVNCLGAASGYVITAGTLLSSGIYAMAPWNTAKLSIDSMKLIIQSSMILALAPLCMMKEISGTKYANLIGLGSLLYIVIVTFIYCDPTAIPTASLTGMTHFLSAMGSFPTFIFAFACQMNVFSIANELKNPTVKRMDIISLASTLTGLIVYVPVMIIPLLAFGAQLDTGDNQNYLKLLDTTAVPVQIAYILAAISVSISYVLQIHPLRRSILCLYYGDRVPAENEEKRNRLLVVTAAMLLTFGIAVGVKKIDVVTNFTGLFGGVTLCFFMPSLLYLRHFGFRKGYFGKMVLGLFGLSILLFPICLAGIIYGMV